MLKARMLLWPYDELRLVEDEAHHGQFQLICPWLTLRFQVAPEDESRARLLSEKMKSGSLTSADLNDFQWLLLPFSNFPLSYCLPRPTAFGEDTHEVVRQISMSSPKQAFDEVLSKESPDGQIFHSQTEWSWNVEAALQLSACPGGYDPITLFSVARRYHLLNEVEKDQTRKLLDILRMPEEKTRAALVLRQNHFITQQCEKMLSSSLKLAQGAEALVRDFIQAEAGHDKIIEKAFKDLGRAPEDLPILPSVVALTALFACSGELNFLAFAMIVDLFERTDYGERDALAVAIEEGGAGSAAKFLDRHRGINDQGAHDNIAIPFLEMMKPVSSEYAIQALRLCEIVSECAVLQSTESIQATL